MHITFCIASASASSVRSLANTIDPLYQLGKDGITKGFIQLINEALEARELIKVTVLRNAEYTAREACEELAEATGAEPVQTIGNRFVLYRRSENQPRIEL